MIKINNITCSGLKMALKLLPYIRWDVSAKLILNAIIRCCYQNNPEKLYRLFEKKHQIIRAWFVENLKNEISEGLKELEDKSKSDNKNELIENAPIWILWWQGKENMPEVVANCYKSVLRNAASHPVILLTSENIKQYLNLPDILYERFEKGIVQIQQMADIVRLQLLHSHGGLWIDSTMYLISPLDESIFVSEFFSLKQDTGIKDNLYVSKYRWDTSFLAARKGSDYMKFLGDIHLTYSIKFDYKIDYFIIDYILDLLTVKNEKFNDIINQLLFNNPGTTVLSEHMNEVYDKDVMAIILKDNFVFKLNHRVSYSELTNTGQKTYWGYFKQLNEIN